MPPLIIFPEGCTTNGKALLRFHKGGFAGLYPVTPVVTQYNGDFMSPSNAILGIILHVGCCLMNFYCTVKVVELPIFRPNEYFWKNHWDGKEEKW